jgi:DnaK suppressor protein
MNKQNLEELKGKLEKEKSSLEESLKRFATKDENMKGDWDTRFPKIDNNVSGSSSLEAAADEVEEYGNLLPQEHSMEIKLKNVNEALDRIKKGTYGKCANCKGEIPIERLMVSPESTLCLQCSNK